MVVMHMLVAPLIYHNCQEVGTINVQNNRKTVALQNDRKTVALPNQTTIISFDIIGGHGAIVKEPRICYVLPFFPPHEVVNIRRQER